MKIKNLIVDTDPGVDDALALFFLSQAKNINIKLVVASAGNKPIETITQNCSYLMNRFNIKAPLVSGSEQPLKRKLVDAGSIHGEVGLGAFNYKMKKQDFNNDYLNQIKNILDANKKVTYLCLGPLTNLAKFLIQHPDYKTKFKEIVFMGGVKDEVIEGDVYPEFNVGVDPEAVESLISMGIKFTVVPSELGHFAFLDPDDVNRIKKTNKLGKDFAKMFDGYFDKMVSKNCVATHDACVAVYLINKKFFKFVNAEISIKYFKEIKTGSLVNNIYNVKKPNAKLAVDIDQKKFKEMLFFLLKKFKE